FVARLGSAGPLSAPRPDASEAKFPRCGLVRPKLGQCLGAEGSAEILQHQDQVFISVAQAIDDELILVDVENDSSARFDARAVGHIEASALGDQDLADYIRLLGVIPVRTACTLPGFR